jgi:NAD(P)H dehydrogenase (quinone)
MENSTKKHFLIVFAHPNQTSFNASIRDKTIQSILSEGHSVEVSDLYLMNFSPFAGKNDFKEHLNVNSINLIDEQQNAMKNDLYVDEIKIEMEKLKKADFLIFIFPVWWASAPSILKGWIDRVFSCDFAWGMKNTFNKGLMIGKRAAIFTSAGGDEHEYSLEGDQQATLTQMLNHIHRGSLAFCGFDVLPLHIIYEVEGSSDELRKEYLDKIDEIIKNFCTADLLHKMSP